MNASSKHDRNFDKPLRDAVMTCVPVQPVLSVKELAAIDATGVRANAGIVSRSPRREQRIARRQAEALRGKWEQQMDTTQEDEHEAAQGMLPTTSRVNRKRKLRDYAPEIPWHSASVPQAGLLDPFVISGYTSFSGPLIGMSLLTGNTWRYDAWEPYKTHAATSVNGWIIGMMGSGKSTCLKAFATRETVQPWNRKVIIEGDPKGEWATVAHAIGGQVVEIGNGSFLNPLDPGARPPTVTPETWGHEVMGIQERALRAIAEVLRPDVRLSAMERAVISALLHDYLDRGQTPTVTAMVAQLDTKWVETVSIRGLNADQARTAANSLILLYDPLIHGAVSGAFELESTINIDPTSPMIVFNTGSVTDNADKKAVYMAAMSSTVERLCAQKDGLFRVIIAEEGYEVLRNPVLVEAWDKRMRLSGDLGVSNWMLLHELGDLEKYAQEGSEQRNQIQSILTLSETQIIYTQSSSSLNLMQQLIPDLNPTEIDMIQSLPEHSGLWRVGHDIRDVIRPMMSAQAYDVFQTDKNRQG